MQVTDKSPPHPGEVLLNHFLERHHLTQKQLSEHLGWTYARLNEIVNAHRGVTADSALAFAEAFETTPEFWLDLQRDWDLYRAKQAHIPVKSLIKAAIDD